MSRTLSDKRLERIWKFAHPVGGWLGLVEEVYRLSEADIEWLIEYDDMRFPYEVTRPEDVFGGATHLVRREVEQDTMGLDNWIVDEQRKLLEDEADMAACPDTEDGIFRRELIKQYRKVETRRKTVKAAISKALAKAGLSKSKGKRRITDEMVEYAKDYPLESIVEDLRRRHAKCPFHTDDHPSLYVKNGFGYCFPCSRRVSSIDYVKEVHSLNFVEAVEFIWSLDK